MRTVALIPIKPASQGKQRLASILDAGARQQLIRLMLDRVVEAVSDTTAVDATYVVTADRSLVPPDAIWMRESGTGLNAALATAAAQLSAHADAVLILPADIPLITPRDLSRLLALRDSTPVVIAPDVSRTGTNALLLAPPTLIAPRFGYGSLAAHMRATLEAGVGHVVYDCVNIARDIDEPGDVGWLLGHSHDPRLDFLRKRPAALAG